ncbi:MAG: C10 family peptidase [Bacteroidetes bacterium]|nr:C10 family peptidase [Bacteroidota bacterium]
MKKIILFFSLWLFSMAMFANPINQGTAGQIAINYFNHYSNFKVTNNSISAVYPQTYEGLVTSYIFTFQTGGFIIISADDAALPILGYSVNNNYDPNNVPEAAAEWLNSYNKEIKAIVDAQMSNKVTILEWNKIQNNDFAKDINIVSPILTTSWDQSGPYNNLCPPPSGQHAYTGCVATAMSQIMKKWNYPTTGSGSHTYTHPTYGSLTANFGTTTYGWANMINSGSGTATQNAAVATIMFHAGVSVDMNYGTSASGAYSEAVPGALINYFNYENTAEIKYKSAFTATNWINLLKAELDANRPVYYSGNDGTSGHAFVCDGYNSSNQFDFNWGWSGSMDGYYTIGNLNPGYQFNQGNAAVVRIRPHSTTMPIADFSVDNSIPGIGIPVTFTDHSLNSPTTWSWTFDGGTPATSNLQTPPTVTFATNGFHQITLTVTNANGSDTKTMEDYINVGGVPSAWIKQNTGFTTANRGIDQVCIVDPQTVWAKAYDGANPTGYIREFTKTNDGGNTWTPGTITFTGSTSYGVANLQAFSYNTAYVAMFPTGATGGMIAKTIDGGTTWTTTGSPSYTTSWLNWVHFFDVNNAVCMGDPASSEFVIYTTSNGGTSWTLVPAANIPNANASETGIVNFYDAVGDTIWFGTSAGRVYRSVDKGLNWTVSNTGIGAAVQTDIRFKNGLVGVAIGQVSPYTMKKTIDGGLTWTALAPTGYFLKLPHLDYVPGTPSKWVNVAGGPGTGSSYSIDDCSTFLDIDTSSSIQYTSVEFFDELTGWAGSFNVSATDGGIYKWNNTSTTVIDNKPKTSFNVFPNPNNGMFTVELNGDNSENLNLSVYNIVGKEVYSIKNIAASNQFSKRINLEGLSNGIYFIKLESNSNSYSQKIILQK